MTTSTITATAPGSLMLMGEHAVLHGHPALVAAIDQRITLTLTPLAEPHIHIESALGTYQTPLNELKESHPFRFVRQVIHHQKTHLQQGFKATIHAEMSPTVGFGTSAAVTVALLAALHQLTEQRHPPETLIHQAVTCIREVQGRGSGADVAASVLGGIVSYQLTEAQFIAETLPSTLPLTIVYSGYKTPTPEVIQTVEAQNKAETLHAIYEVMGHLVTLSTQLLAEGETQAVGELWNQHYKLQQKIGVSDETLHRIVTELQQAPGIQGAKISGAGLGDCAIGLGTCNNLHHGTLMNTTISTGGIHVSTS